MPEIENRFPATDIPRGPCRDNNPRKKTYILARLVFAYPLHSRNVIPGASVYSNKVVTFLVTLPAVFPLIEGEA